ncbi:MAG: tetratricopeptide repeat protein [Candidatus Aureabacteria bacterium]|nr:tetratricopeptide repeat protein [Candidatus Auribacterota bacterium]
MNRRILKTLTCLVFAVALSVPIAGAPADYDFGDATTKTLTAKAWNALQLKDYNAVSAYVDKCLSLYSKKALEQQASLTDHAPKDEANNYWALNDVGTCLFIKGKALREQGKKDEAKKVFEDLIKNYTYAQCWDPCGWFWKVSEAAKDHILGMEKNVDFGNYASETLTVKGWGALDAGEYEKAVIYADKCLELYGPTARDMQKTLKDFASKEKAFDYWALNDVSTCLFIKGKALKALGKNEEARKVFETIINDYSFGQCWDTQGWFWKVAQGAKNEIQSIETGIDFGNASSETLVSRAWEALGTGKYKDVELYVNKCLELYGDKAKEMQSALKKQGDYAASGKEFDYPALNDVGTCLFILGRAYYIQGKNDLAKEAYNKIIDNYSFAQCWDTQGWFWKPAEGAKDQLLLMETGIDFGDYTSMTLTVKAWNALDSGNYDEVLVYCRKCIQLYTSLADEQQSSLSSYLPKEKAFDAWALNDVGVCYFIMGEAHLGKKEYKKALEAYRTLVEKYFYSQCWDPKGWFWKPAVAARGKINKIAAEQGLM